MIKLNEGVEYNGDVFEIKFESNSTKSIIEIDELPLSVYDGLDYTFYFGYKFSDNSDSKTRKEFFNALRFPNKFKINLNDRREFIHQAMIKLHDVLDLRSLDFVIFPKSRSELNMEIINEIRFETGKNKPITIELIKELPANITFDYDSFMENELESTKNGRYRYTNKQKLEQLKIVEDMMKNINSSNYFSIGEVKGNKYKKYFTNYLLIDEKYRKQLEMILDSDKVLIIDDVTTTKTTIVKCVQTIRSIIGPKIPIYVFTLIGKDKY